EGCDRVCDRVCVRGKGTNYVDAMIIHTGGRSVGTPATLFARAAVGEAACLSRSPGLVIPQGWRARSSRGAGGAGGSGHLAGLAVLAGPVIPAGLAGLAPCPMVAPRGAERALGRTGGGKLRKGGAHGSTR